MADCKWMHDEICVNKDCPMVADYCPVADIEGVCRHEDRKKGGNDYVKIDLMRYVSVFFARRLRRVTC